MQGELKTTNRVGTALFLCPFKSKFFFFQKHHCSDNMNIAETIDTLHCSHTWFNTHFNNSLSSAIRKSLPGHFDRLFKILKVSTFSLSPNFRSVAPPPPYPIPHSLTLEKTKSKLTKISTRTCLFVRVCNVCNVNVFSCLVFLSFIYVIKYNSLSQTQL